MIKGMKKFEDFIGDYGRLHDNSEILPIDYSILKDGQRWKFKIPVGNLSKGEAEKIIKKLIDKYKEDIIWDEKIGEIKKNDTLPYNKDYWIPVKNDSTVVLENKNDDTQTINDSKDYIKYVIEEISIDKEIKKSWYKRIFNKK